MCAPVHFRPCPAHINPPRRRPLLPQPCTAPTHPRRLRSPPSRHTNAPPTAAAPLRGTNPCAPTAAPPTPPHQQAAHRCPTPARNQPLRADCAHLHLSRPTRRPSLPCPCMTPTHARQLRWSLPLHKKTPPIAAPPQRAINACAPPGSAPTSSNQSAAHLRPAPARHKPLSADCAEPLRSTPTRRQLLPRPCAPPTLALRLRSPSHVYTNAPPISALPLDATNPCAPTALGPSPPHKHAAHFCLAPTRHQPLRADCARPHPAAPTRRPSLPCPWIPPTHARRLRWPLPLNTKTPPIAAPPLHSTNPCAPTALNPSPPHQDAAIRCPTPARH